MIARFGVSVSLESSKKEVTDSLLPMFVVFVCLLSISYVGVVTSSEWSTRSMIYARFVLLL